MAHELQGILLSRPARDGCLNARRSSTEIIYSTALGRLTYGYCASIIGRTLTQPSFISYFALDIAANASQLKGAISGLLQAVGLVGTLFCTRTAD